VRSVQTSVPQRPHRNASEAMGCPAVGGRRPAPGPRSPGEW
jgi:hypothetical protein